MMNIKVEYEDFKKFQVKVQNKSSKINTQIATEIKKSTFKISRDAKNNLASNGSVVTGNLRRGIGTNISQTQGEVHTSNIKYAIYVEKGTKPHIIKPKNKKMLYWKCASHPVKLVNHPGSQAKPYLIPAFEKQKPEFIKALQKVVKLNE